MQPEAVEQSLDDKIEIDYDTEISAEYLPKSFLGFQCRALNTKNINSRPVLKLSTIKLNQPVIVNNYFMLVDYVPVHKMQQRPGFIVYLYSAFEIFKQLFFLGERYGHRAYINIQGCIALSKLPVDVFRKYFGNEPIPCWHAVAYTRQKGLSFVVPVLRARLNEITGKDEIILRWYTFQRLNFRTPVVEIWGVTS